VAPKLARITRAGGRRPRPERDRPRLPVEADDPHRLLAVLQRPQRSQVPIEDRAIVGVGGAAPGRDEVGARRDRTAEERLAAGSGERGRGGAGVVDEKRVQLIADPVQEPLETADGRRPSGRRLRRDRRDQLPRPAGQRQGRDRDAKTHRLAVGSTRDDVLWGRLRKVEGAVESRREGFADQFVEGTAEQHGEAGVPAAHDAVRVERAERGRAVAVVSGHPHPDGIGRSAVEVDAAVRSIASM
jgi:hypothetical protein